MPQRRTDPADPPPYRSKRCSRCSGRGEIETTANAGRERVRARCQHCRGLGRVELKDMPY